MNLFALKNYMILIFKKNLFVENVLFIVLQRVYTPLDPPLHVACKLQNEMEPSFKIIIIVIFGGFDKFKKLPSTV